MLIRSVPWFVFFALVTGSSISDAQVPADSLIAGDLVQYELSEPLRDLPQESKGTLEALSPSVVLLSEVEDLEAGGMVELPRELISDFEVARGEEDVRWLLAGIGGVAGLFVAVSAIVDESANSPGDAVILLPLVGTLGGYGLGRLIKSPRWEDVEFD